MDKIKICEAMYALPNGVVVRRRKSLLIPVVLFVAGVALLMVNMSVGAELTNNLRSALVFIGGGLALGGMITFVGRTFGAHGVPYYAQGRCYLRYDELYFERAHRDVVAQYVEAGRLQQLLAMNQTHVPAIAVAIYRTPDNRFAAMQAFEYTELEYRPLTGLKIVE